MSASLLYSVSDKQRPDGWSALEEAEVCDMAVGLLAFILHWAAYKEISYIGITNIYFGDNVLIDLGHH